MPDYDSHVVSNKNQKCLKQINVYIIYSLSAIKCQKLCTIFSYIINYILDFNICFSVLPSQFDFKLNLNFFPDKIAFNSGISSLQSFQISQRNKNIEIL